MTAAATVAAAFALAIAENNVLADAERVAVGAFTCSARHPDLEGDHVHVSVSLSWSDSPAACQLLATLAGEVAEDPADLGAAIARALDAGAAARERIILSERAPDYPPADLGERGGDR